jgi:hypothetical protein
LVEAALEPLVALDEPPATETPELPLGFAVAEAACGVEADPDAGLPAVVDDASEAVALDAAACEATVPSETTGRSLALGSTGAFPDTVKATAAVASMAAVTVTAMFATVSFVMSVPKSLPGTV